MNFIFVSFVKHNLPMN